MSDLKKIRKKLLKSVLGTTLLAVGLVSIQSISAMSSNKKRLEEFFLLNVMQNIRDKETLKKYAQINKKCRSTLVTTYINPIPVTKENVTKLFPQLQTLCLYGSKTNVDEIKDKKIIFDYSFGIGELIHCVSFFNGYDKKYSDDLLNRLNKLKKELPLSDEQKKLSIELNDLLFNLPIIYEREYKYLKNFITCIAPDFGEFKEFKHEHLRYKRRLKTTVMEDEDIMEDAIDVTVTKAMEGIKYTYKIIETKSKSKKALVYIMVNEGSQLTKSHLTHIIEELKKQEVEINIDSVGATDCKNIIFTIRPEKEQRFKISEDSFCRFCNLTVNIVRAEAGYHAFHGCSDLVINIYDSYFGNKEELVFGGSVNACDNLTLNVHCTNLDQRSIGANRGNMTLNIYDDSQLSRDAIMWCTISFASSITLNNYSNVQFDAKDIKENSFSIAVVVNDIKKK